MRFHQPRSAPSSPTLDRRSTGFTSPPKSPNGLSATTSYRKELRLRNSNFADTRYTIKYIRTYMYVLIIHPRYNISFLKKMTIVKEFLAHDIVGHYIIYLFHCSRKQYSPLSPSSPEESDSPPERLNIDLMHELRDVIFPNTPPVDRTVSFRQVSDLIRLTD